METGQFTTLMILCHEAILLPLLVYLCNPRKTNKAGSVQLPLHTFGHVRSYWSAPVLIRRLVAGNLLLRLESIWVQVTALWGVPPHD